MAGPFGAILGAVAAPLLGGLLGKSADRQAAQPAMQTTQVNNAPWSGVQPYLVGSTPPPAYLTQDPADQLPMAWLQWAQGSGEGTNLSAPPPMRADSIRGELGIGMPGGKPAKPARKQPKAKPKPKAKVSLPNRENSYEEAYRAGYRGNVAWANQRGINSMRSGSPGSLQSGTLLEHFYHAGKEARARQFDNNFDLGY